MDTLPSELLFKIMLYLPLEDRLSCSLTCRRWAEYMASSQLLHDVWLDIAGHEMEAARSVLIETQRQYRNLLLYKADLSKLNPEFWRRIGSNLRVVQLEECSWSSCAFYAMLQQCPKLESLKFVHKYGKISIDDFVLPEGIRHEELRDPLTHLRHLHLEIKFTAEVLDLLLGLMPNVTSIFLSPTPDKDVEPDFLELLPSILDKNRIIRTGAHFGRMEIGDERMMKFVERTSGSLEELRVGADQLTKSSFDAIINGTRLRRLAFKARSYTSFDASHLKKLASNSPHLEILELPHNLNLKNEDMVHLFEFKKLRTLSLAQPYEITKEFPCNLGKISTLVKLDLSFSHVDGRVLQSLGCLANLRCLVLASCHDPECFDAISENCERLTELNLGDVYNLWHPDGIELCRFKELRSLRFRHGYNLTDSTFAEGVGSRSLKYLFIGGCSLTDAGLESIAAHHDRLEELYLLACDNITNIGVSALLQKQSRIKILGLSPNFRGRDELIKNLSHLCPRLREGP